MKRFLRSLFDRGGNDKPRDAKATARETTDDAFQTRVLTLCNEHRYGDANALIDSQATTVLSADIAAMLRGNVAMMQNRFDLAATHFRAAIDLGNRELVVRRNLISSLLQLGMPYHAEAELTAAFDRFEQSGDLEILRARIFLQTQRQREGEAILLELLQNADAPLDALSSLISHWLKNEDSRRACDYLAKRVAAGDDSAPTQALLGMSRHKNNELTAAEQHYRNALARGGDNAETWDQLGMVLRDQGNVDEAIACYERSIAANPQHPLPRWDRSLALLLDGQFDAGWPDYELRFLNNELQTGFGAFPRWNGATAADQTLLIVGEQGLGDEIMFASCIPDAISRVRHAVVHCHPKLERIFRRSFPACTVTSGALLDALAIYPKDMPLIDTSAAIGSLPMLLGRNHGHFPPAHPYLRGDDARIAVWRERLAQLGTGLKIGISWRGGTQHSRRTLRSVPLDDWLPILKQPGCHFINLQYADAHGDLRDFEQRHGLRITHWQDAIDDYDETAALVSALDLVISVQTAIIHLAGGLGRRAWVLIPACPEWRYQRRGDTMPWYANVKLYRQQSISDWREPIERAANDLATLRGHAERETTS